MRMRGFLRKEVLQIYRDPSSIALAIILPMVLLFIFGYGVSLDAEDVPLAVVLDDPAPKPVTWRPASICQITSTPTTPPRSSRPKRG